MKKQIENKKISPPTVYSKGFTLIETFVAITILLIVVLGPMSLLSSALKNSRYVKDEIIATHLAQEGVELMIHQRNNESLRFPDPLTINCHLDVPLKFEPDLGYQCSFGEETIFTRKVTVLQIGVSDQYKITSTVTRSNFPGKIIESKSVIFK